jgi:hypothetical protein
LDTSKHLEAFPVDKVQGVLTFLEALSSALADLKAPEYSMVVTSSMQRDNGVGDDFCRFQRDHSVRMRRSFMREQSRESFAP